MADTWLRNAVAEAVGTLILVFATVLALAGTGQATSAVITYGFVVMAMMAALGHVSGGHFNPAVTLAMLLAKKIDGLGAVVYWIAQFAGGILGALLVRVTTQRDAVVAGAPVVHDDIVNIGGALTLEALATFFVILIFFGTVEDERAPVSVYPFAIGAAFAAGDAALLNITGGALNPARGLGPAVVTSEWDGIAAWIVGPLVGAVVAWALYTFVIADRQRVTPGSRSSRRHVFPEPVPPPGPSLMP